uniref:XRN2-binding (XTBD) domain-containing protein n=1 Tax=Strongyloides venezuelensis TaxID=75913 RepID=A0A0K0G0B9_STRVS
MEDEIPEWIEKARLKHETETEWMLREAFLKKNFNDYNKEKLLMYSRVFVNHYMMGCQYDPRIIDKVKEMAIGISLERLRSEKRSFTNLTAANAKKYSGKKIKGGIPDIPVDTYYEKKTDSPHSPTRKKGRYDSTMQSTPVDMMKKKKTDEEVLKDELLLFRNKYTLRDTMGNSENILSAFCQDIGKEFVYDIDSDYVSRIMIGRVLVFSHSFYFDVDVAGQASFVACNILISGNLEVVKSADDNPLYDYLLLSDNENPDNAYFRFITSFLSSLPHQDIPEDGELRKHVEKMAQESGLTFYVDKFSDGGWAMDITLRIGELVVGMKHLNKEENKQAEIHINNLIVTFLEKLNTECGESKLEIEINSQGILCLKY